MAVYRVCTYKKNWNKSIEKPSLKQIFFYFFLLSQTEYIREAKHPSARSAIEIN